MKNYKANFTERAAEFICDYIKEDTTNDSNKAVFKMTPAAQELILEVLDDAPQGTPFAIGDEISKVYFNTNKSIAEMKEIFNKLTFFGGGESPRFAQFLTGINVVDLSSIDPLYAGEYGIVCGEQEEFAYLTKTCPAGVEGWNMSAVPEGVFDFGETIPVNYIDPAEGWNGTLVSKTPLV